MSRWSKAANDAYKSGKGKHEAPQPPKQGKAKGKGRNFPAAEKQSALSKLFKGPGKHHSK